MAQVVRVIGVASVAAALVAGMIFIFLGKSPDWTGLALVLSPIGGVIGAIAGASAEIVGVLQQRPLSREDES